MSSGWIVVPWILVIVGWWVADRTANERECRKEMRSLLDVFIKLASEIEDRALVYHSQATRPAPIKEMEIKAGLARLSEILTTALDRKLCDSRWLRNVPPPSGSQIRFLVIQFRQSATLSNFETNSFSQQGGDSKILKEISSRRDNLINETERAFTVRYY